jgi:hypothetical protein
MSAFYSDQHRNLQDAFGTRALADALEMGIVHNGFTESEREFIQSRDMFFLSTVDINGRPTVSYKGGAPGFVSFDGNDLVFPSYNGNGMFYSMGNLETNPSVGLLFIDFVTPRRLRVQGEAALLKCRSGAKTADFLVRVTPTDIFVNCSRYVHSYTKTAASRHVPKDGVVAPLAAWKRIASLRDSLLEEDRIRVDAEGTITEEEYEALVAAGRS